MIRRAFPVNVKSPVMFSPVLANVVPFQVRLALAPNAPALLNWTCVSAPAGAVTGVVPLPAAVSLPCASTVKFAYVYAPGVTDVFAKSTVIVPLVVTGVEQQ